jgi:ergothioneine biosynthesis protein EgtB
MQDTAQQEPAGLAGLYLEVRRFSEKLCEPLVTEDYVIQSMPDVSPTKWHLAHTTWFFETFLLPDISRNYRPFDPGYRYLFNSYYNAVGPQFPRPRRGLLARPTVEQVWQYRRYVDRAVLEALAGTGRDGLGALAGVFELGLNHEQQHQELMLTDLKHVFSCNPLRPVYRARSVGRSDDPGALHWKDCPGDLHWIGHAGAGFAFDNEMPRHQVFVTPYRLAARLVTNAEYTNFMADGGYRRPELWLSAGWDAVRAHGWEAPLYWEQQDGQWLMMTLSGLRAVEPHEPVCHVSYFEADAYARWAGARLPSEAEWEIPANGMGVCGNFAGDGNYHPLPLRPPGSGEAISQMFGDVWEWTASAYAPYPGFQPAAGALGEYNGKFMCNQLVLRGGSCATPRSHIRATYRNFFPPEARWQFSGIRLAGDVA